MTTLCRLLGLLAFLVAFAPPAAAQGTPEPSDPCPPASSADTVALSVDAVWPYPGAYGRVTVATWVGTHRLERGTCVRLWDPPSAPEDAGTWGVEVLRERPPPETDDPDEDGRGPFVRVPLARIRGAVP